MHFGADSWSIPDMQQVVTSPLQQGGISSGKHSNSLAFKSTLEDIIWCLCSHLAPLPSLHGGQGFCLLCLVGPLDDTVNSESMMGVRTVDPSEVIGYHIYAAFMGKVST